MFKITELNHGKEIVLTECKKEIRIAPLFNFTQEQVKEMLTEYYKIIGKAINQL